MDSLVKNYGKLNIDESEVFRYAGCKSDDALVKKALFECIDEAIPLIRPSICYKEIDKSDIEKFFAYSKEGSPFVKYTNGSSKAILFAATIGFGFDRLISKYEKVSLLKAQLLQALGAQQVEELCDVFCKEMKTIYPKSKPRFSPGYGELNLASQKLVFEMLCCSKKIGISLGESFLMSPSKSVTAFICIED